MFEEAAALASSILTRLYDNRHLYIEDEILLHEMMESSAMVLVQSWRETGRYMHYTGLHEWSGV